MGSAEMGSDGLGRFSGAVNLPVGSDLALRVGYENGRSNGFRSNAFLDADDTNGRREQLLRAKVGWTPAAGPEVVGHLLLGRYGQWVRRLGARQQRGFDHVL